jgi:hypothetical protein
MNFYKLKKAEDGKHKYTIIFKTKEGKEKKISFGAMGYDDYIITNDDKKKEAYIARHKVREDWNDPFSKGALSRYILWNKKTLKESLDDYLKRFKINKL